MLSDSMGELIAMLTEIAIIGIAIGTTTGFVCRWLTRSNDRAHWSNIQADLFASAIASVASLLSLLPIVWATHGSPGAMADRLATYSLAGAVLLPPVVVVALCGIRARRRRNALRERRPA
jgi:hypothetical protein